MKESAVCTKKMVEPQILMTRYGSFFFPSRGVCRVNVFFCLTCQFFAHCVLFLLPHSNQGSVIKNARKMFGKSSRIKSRLGDMSRVVELDSEVCLPVGSGPEDITI